MQSVRNCLNLHSKIRTNAKETRMAFLHVAYSFSAFITTECVHNIPIQISPNQKTLFRYIVQRRSRREI